MERSRTEWLRSLGFEQDELMRDARVMFAVKHAEADYLRPARFNDKLQVSSRLAGMGRANMVIEHEISHALDDRLLCKGMVKIVCLDVDDFRPRPIPQPIFLIMEKMQDAE
jgi:acyl-CoA thioester hydrolase